MEHKCNMIDRSKIELTGVNKVISFDTNEILLSTEMGGLLMKGVNLHINQLSLEKSIVQIEGKIDALIYSEKSPEDRNIKGVVARLFR